MKSKNVRIRLRIRARLEKVNESHATDLVVPVLQPFPTTKSPAPEKLTEYPFELGEKFTLPPVL